MPNNYAETAIAASRTNLADMFGANSSPITEEGMEQAIAAMPVREPIQVRASVPKVTVGALFTRNPDDNQHALWLAAGVVHANALALANATELPADREAYFKTGILEAAVGNVHSERNVNKRYPAVEAVNMTLLKDMSLSVEADQEATAEEVYEQRTASVRALLANGAIREEGDLTRLIPLNNGYINLWNGLRRAFPESAGFDALMDNRATSTLAILLDFVGLDYQMRFYEHTLGTKPTVYLCVNDTQKCFHSVVFIGAHAAVELKFKDF